VIVKIMVGMNEEGLESKWEIFRLLSRLVWEGPGKPRIVIYSYRMWIEWDAGQVPPASQHVCKCEMR